MWTCFVCTIHTMHAYWYRHMHIIILILKKYIYLSIYLAVYLSIYVAVYLSIYLYICYPPKKKTPSPADVTWFVEVDRWNACEYASRCHLVCGSGSLECTWTCQRMSVGLLKGSVGMHMKMPPSVTWFVEGDGWNACEHASWCQLVCWSGALECIWTCQ